MSRRGSILQDYGNINHTQTMEAQHNAAQYYQRDKEQANQMKMQQAAQKKKDSGDAVDFISGLNVPDIGDNTIDLYNDAQIKAVQDKLMDMMQKGAGVNDIKMAAIPELQKISQGYTIGKNEYAKVAQGVKDLSKDYPTGDTEQARNIAGQEMLKNIFEFDENGKVKGYKDPSLITPDKNYLENLTNNQNLPKWYRRSGAYEKGIKSLPLPAVGGSTSYTDKYGKKVKQSYTGHGSIFDEPIVNNEGEQTGWRLKSESVPLGRNTDGSLIIASVMPKEQFAETISTPAAKLDFQLDFNKYLEDTGVNPDSLDPRARDVLERKFAYDQFERTGIHGSSFLTKDEIKEAPIRNVTNVRVNAGGSGKPSVPVMDIVTPVRSYFENVGEQKEGLKGVAQLNLFNNEVTTPVMNEVKVRYPDITADDIYYQKSGNDIWVMKADETGKVNKQKDVPVFKLDDFTNVSGNKPQGVKSKNEALRQAQSGKTETKPAAGSKTISATKLRSLVGTKGYEGYTEKELQDYYRSNGYEIK